MPDYRTDFEKRLGDFVADLNAFMDTLAVQPRQRRSFTAIRGKLRDLRVHLENRRSGCPSGTHSMACTCTTERKGVYQR